ncbi:MAG: CPBP family intramembrane metalloprotease [Bacteroidales bacterium]|nr:CPBP family intramembrane metalloprotease [Bacteroidales bacterium]
MNQFFENRGFWFRFLTLIVIALTAVFMAVTFGTVFASLFFGTDKIASHHIDTVLFLQAFVSVGLFVAPPLVYAKVFDESLTLKNKPKLLSAVLCVAIMAVSMPFCSFLEELNLHMKLPVWLSGLEDWMRAQENNAKELTDMLLGNREPKYLLLNILVIALIPALGEELFFRGVIQDSLLFKTSKIRGWLCVLITGAVFSAIHLQFFGFLPRFFLGAVLGLMLLMTKSIWTSILCHFCNNAFAVLAAGYFSTEKMNDVPQIFEFKSVIIISAVLTAFLFWQLKKIEDK